MRTGSGEYHEEALTKLIKLLAGNLRANFGLTEDLVYYYQLKRLEANTVPSSFAENSLIELLALRRPPGEVSYGLCERLGTRISQLGL